MTSLVKRISHLVETVDGTDPVASRLTLHASR